LKNQNRIDDGRRNMPKHKCPYCGKRTIDVGSKELWRDMEISKFDDKIHFDMVINCSICKGPIGIIFKSRVA